MSTRVGQSPSRVPTQQPRAAEGAPPAQPAAPATPAAPAAAPAPSAPASPATAAEPARAPTSQQRAEGSAQFSHQVGAQLQQARAQVGPRATEVPEHAHDHDHGQARGGAAARGGAPRYDTDTWRLGTLEDSLPNRRLPTTEADRTSYRAQFETQLQAAYPNGYTLPPGLTRGSNEELRAMHAMLQVSNLPNGRETDLMVPRPGQEPLRMTFNRAANGSMTATEQGVGAPAVPAGSRFTDAAAARTAIERDFGMRVQDGTGTWNLEELQRAHQAFSAMPAEDRARLRGVDLVRSSTPGPETDAFTGDRSRLSAFYSGNTTAVDGARVRPAAIHVYDQTFAGDRTRFVGGSANPVPPSVQTITHEAGHAVEGQRRNEAAAAQNATAQRYNATEAPLTQALNGYTTAQGEVNAAGRSFARTRLPPGASSDATRQLRDFNTAARSMAEASTALANARTPEQISTARQRLSSATTQRDAALAALPQAQAGPPAVAAHPARSAAETYSRVLDTQAAASGRVGDAAGTRAAARGEYDAAVAEVAAQSTRGESAVLHNYQEMMRRTRSTAPTDYGATDGAESFAESYSLFQTDPDWLRTNRPAVYQWFADGNHLEPR